MTATGPITIGTVTFDVDTLVAAGGMVIIGFQSVLFWLFTRVYATVQRASCPSRRGQRSSSPGCPWSECSSSAASLGLPGWQA